MPNFFLGNINNPQAPKRRPYNPFGYVDEAQNLARESVQGFGEQLRPGLEREIGNALGGLNEIGALRSGGANVALRDISTNYAQQVGAFAKQATGDVIGAGLEARRLRDEEKRYQNSRRGGIFRAIGSVLGAGAGFLIGGPGGAVAGASAGGSVAGTGPNGWGGSAQYD